MKKESFLPIDNLLFAQHIHYLTLNSLMDIFKHIYCLIKKIPLHKVYKLNQN
jgi:hypothetical protein